MNYLISASILLLAVWPMYHLLLRYSEKYTLNRLLLLLAFVTVVALPFVSFSSPVPEVTETLQGTITYLEDGVTSGGASIDPVPSDIYYNKAGEEIRIANPAVVTFNMLPKVYYLGLGLLTLVLGFRLLLLLSLHLRSRLSSNGQYRLLHAGASSGQAFTFGTSLYFSADVVNGPDFDHVLAHERVHARQGHSLDILLSELFLCALWFHPAAWWLRAKMRANLEFLVDKAVISGGADRRDYQLALVRQSAAAQGLALTLPFSEPSLKSRISRMTGLPEYRVVGIVATFALLFWLGTAAVVINGQKGESTLNWENAERPVLNTAEGGPTATEFLYGAYVSQAMPDEIDAFELYFKRLPTPGEYLQLKAIMREFPHTEFSIYEPCNGTPGTYVMQLSHYLKQEAVFRTPLREGELIPHHFVFSLDKRTTSQPIPNDLPLDSYGYYEPRIDNTTYEIIETDEGLGAFDGTETRLINNGVPPWGVQRMADAWRVNIQEDLEVYINGKRFELLPEPDVKFEDGMQFAGYVDGDKEEWHGVEGKVTDPNALPSSLDAAPSLTYVPPNARMACLLGMEGNPKGMIRRVIDSRSGPKGYLKAYIDGSLMALIPNDNSVPYRVNNNLLYLNDVLISKEELLKMDWPRGTYLQIGRNSNIVDGPTIIQVITDMNWR
jgi:hypothetical protein